MPRSKRATLHFASQQAADSYIVSTRIQTIQQTRATRSSAARLAGLQERVAAINAPIHKLSDDLLSMIFLAAYEDSERSAVTISHVTSRFRRVATSTPRLWTSVTIRLPYPSSSHVAGLKKMSLRSGALPLSVRIHIDPQMDKTGFTTAVIDLLAGLLSRCRRLSLNIDRWMIFWKLDLYPSTVMDLFRCPLLEALDLNSINHSMDWAMKLWTTFDQCPRLAELTVAPPLSPSRHFYGQEITLSTIQKASANCNVLFSGVPFILPNCMTLNLSGSRFYALGGSHTFKQWQLPALRRILLTWTPGCELRTWSVIGLLLAFPTIQELAITEPMLIHDGTTSQQYPARFTLQTLTIEHVQGLIAPFLTRLLDPSDPHDPRVQVGALEVRGCYPMEDETKNWLDAQVAHLQWTPRTVSV